MRGEHHQNTERIIALFIVAFTYFTALYKKLERDHLVTPKGTGKENKP